MSRQERIYPLASVEGRSYSRPRQAVILAGGRGERMRPLTDDKPKPMIPVNGRPFLEHQIVQLREQGFERVLLLLGYRADVVRNYFGDGAQWGIRIDYAITAPELLTSSRVAAARHLIDECFLLLYCDNFWPMQMERLWARFCEAGKPALITVYANEDGYSKGGVRLADNGDVLAFDRDRSSPGLNEVEISYAILTYRALDALPDEDAPFEEAVYTALARQGRLTAFRTGHRYYGVGSFARLAATERFFRRTPSVILDRDGVLNRRMAPGDYVKNWDEWQWCEGALEALQLFHSRGFRVFVATNQPGIGRGVISAADLTTIHSKMVREAQRAGGSIDAIFHCPHGWDEGCDCRKPRPGLLYQAQREYELDLTRTVFVGDDDRDAEAALAAGCRFRRVTNEVSLLEIAEDIVSQKDM
jgi:histidinol-phosphate phosphatase family protein